MGFLTIFGTTAFLRCLVSFHLFIVYLVVFPH